MGALATTVKKASGTPAKGQEPAKSVEAPPQGAAKKQLETEGQQQVRLLALGAGVVVLAATLLLMSRQRQNPYDLRNLPPPESEEAQYQDWQSG